MGSAPTRMPAPVAFAIAARERDPVHGRALLLGAAVLDQLRDLEIWLGRDRTEDRFEDWRPDRLLTGLLEPTAATSTRADMRRGPSVAATLSRWVRRHLDTGRATLGCEIGLAGVAQKCRSGTGNSRKHGRPPRSHQGAPDSAHVRGHLARRIRRPRRHSPDREDAYGAGRSIRSMWRCVNDSAAVVAYTTKGGWALLGG